MTTVLAQGGFNVLQSLQSGFTQLIGYLPQIIGALLVLLIGYIIARILRTVVTKLLKKGRMDERLTSDSGEGYVERLSPQGSPSRLVGTVLFAVIMLFVISSAIGTLGIPALTGFMNTVLSYLPRVIAALLIFLAAAAVASAVGGLAQRMMGDTPLGRVVRTAAPTLVMAIGVFMILTQLNIAPVIVTITYAALIGALALGSALAFGLGGREAAAEMINTGYRRAQEEQETAKHGMRSGEERTGTGSQSWTMQSGGGDAEPQGRPEAEQAPSGASEQQSGPGQERGGSYRAT